MHLWHVSFSWGVASTGFIPIPAPITGEVPVVATAQPAATTALFLRTPGIRGFQVPRLAAVTGWFAYIHKLGPARFADPEGCRYHTRITLMARAVRARPKPEVH